MNSTRLTATAAQMIDTFDAAAHHLIEAWREAGDRLGGAARARWNRALKASSPQLDAETRRNAMRTRRVVGRCWTRGVARCADSASTAVEGSVGLARMALARASARQAPRA